MLGTVNIHDHNLYVKFMNHYDFIMQDKLLEPCAVVKKMVEG